MKIIILSPNADSLFNSSLINKIKKSGDLILIKKITPFPKISELFSNKDEKVLAIDPDFVEWKFPNEFISKIPNLKAICLQSTSFNWVDVNLAKNENIPVTNLRNWSTQAVVEWILMSTLVLARKIPLVIKEGWNKNFEKYKGVELRGKTAGILGLGNIGTRLAESCKALGMEVIYWSRKSRDKRFRYTSIANLLKTADFIYPVLVNNNETQKLLPNSLISTVKPTSFWIDIYMAQDTHDKEFLIKMVGDGKLFGYAYEAGSKKFGKHSGNIWEIPESAWPTDGSMKRNAEQWVDTITKASRGIFTNRLN